MSNNRSDWARACRTYDVAPRVAAYLKEFSQAPYPVGETDKRLYSDAILNVPPEHQREVLSISMLDEDCRALVNNMAQAKKVTARHARLYAKEVAKRMWNSVPFRKRLAEFWGNMAMLRDAEVKALDDFEAKPPSKEMEDIVARRRRKHFRMIGFYERRVIDCGLEKNVRAEDRSQSVSELSDEEDDSSSQ